MTIKKDDQVVVITGKDKGKLQTELVEDEKIKVLGPALGISFVNGAHPLKSSK